MAKDLATLWTPVYRSAFSKSLVELCLIHAMFLVEELERHKYTDSFVIIFRFIPFEMLVELFEKYHFHTYFCLKTQILSVWVAI